MNHDPAFDALCDDAKTRIQEITVDDAADMMGQEDVFLIDVRDTDEYDAFRIANAIHLSKGWAEAKIHTVVHDKDAPVILYCGGGNRSALVADNLQKMGYTDVSSMRGGIKAWVKAGKKVVE